MSSVKDSLLLDGAVWTERAETSRQPCTFCSSPGEWVQGDLIPPWVWAVQVKTAKTKRYNGPAAFQLETAHCPIVVYTNLVTLASLHFHPSDKLHLIKKAVGWVVVRRQNWREKKRPSLSSVPWRGYNIPSLRKMWGHSRASCGHIVSLPQALLVAVKPSS